MDTFKNDCGFDASPFPNSLVVFDRSVACKIDTRKCLRVPDLEASFYEINFFEFYENKKKSYINTLNVKYPLLLNRLSSSS